MRENGPLCRTGSQIPTNFLQPGSELRLDPSMLDC